MPSLREIRRKVKSIQSTRQIFRAMKMVAAARMRRAQKEILSSRPFAVRLQGVLENWLMSGLGEEIMSHLLLQKRESSKIGWVVISSDKGFCGAFNANLLRQCVQWLRRHESDEVYAFLVGKKARDFIRRLRLPKVRVVEEVTGIFPRVRYAHAEILGESLLRTYREEGLCSVTVLFNEFISMVQQRNRLLEILPLSYALSSEVSPKHTDYLYEPRSRELLDVLLPRALKAHIYRILLESQAAELAARMNAMESATQNAGELLDGLKLRLNRTRQALITKEIAELVGGAEALSAAA